MIDAALDTRHPPRWSFSPFLWRHHPATRVAAWGCKLALGWCKLRGKISEVPRIESPGENVVGTPDTKRRHKAEAIPLSPEEVNAIIDELPEFSERARRGHVRHRVRDVDALWWETGLRPVSIAKLR
ncbi:MAG TPA: hypothetical protein VF873_09650, partial [Gemmatimonadales bacterium]